MLTDVKARLAFPLLHHMLGLVSECSEIGPEKLESGNIIANECCNAIFALDGNESLAGACGICQRNICYLCSVALAGDESITELMNICENCREEI